MYFLSTPTTTKKYRNKITSYDNKRFDSKVECRRYQALKMMEMAKEISDLETQVKYDLVVNGVKICSYVADFRYKEGDEIVVEDVKSPATAKLSVFQMKKKLMKAIHGIKVQVVIY